MIARAGLDPYGAARFLEALGRSGAMRAGLSGRGAAPYFGDLLTWSVIVNQGHVNMNRA